MKKLSDIKPELLDYIFNYDQSNDYSKYAFERYADNVVSIRKTPKFYFILLRGSKKFFGYRFCVPVKKVFRFSNLKKFSQKRGRVLDKKEFRLFEKGLILEELSSKG